MMCQLCHLRYNLTEPPDGKWGSPGSNLEFNGMIGQLQREVSLLSFTKLLTVLSTVIEKVLFSIPLHCDVGIVIVNLYVLILIL